MKNNTTSNDNRYTIQPLTTSIDIETERKLIASWHTSRLTDTQIRKMLMLYFGKPEWMNEQKQYPSYRFSDIAEGLRFHNRHDFVEILLRCSGFGFIWKNDEKPHTDQNLMAFYTPIWHVSDEKDMGNNHDLNSSEQTLPPVINNNIYNKKKNNKKKNISKNVTGSKTCSAEYEKEVEAAAKELLNYIGTDPDAYAKVVKPVNEITQKLNPNLYINPEDACPTNRLQTHSSTTICIPICSRTAR